MPRRGQEPPYRDVTVGDLLTRLSLALPDREALVYQRGPRYTFATLEAEACRIARGLMAVGVERGERVAVWATNVPEWVVLQFALAKVGAILVTVNTALQPAEVEYLLRQSESCTLVTIRGVRDLDYVNALISIGATRCALPALKRIIFIGDVAPEGLMPYAELARRADTVRTADLDIRARTVGLDDVINMQYTSGTTGFPQGGMLSSRNIVTNGYVLGANLAYTPEDRLCLCVPLFHCFGCVIGVLGGYTHGVCLCPIESFDPVRVLETVHCERCTAL